MAKCRIDDCSLNTFGDNEECVLHCDKHDYHSDSKSGLLKYFHKELINVIANYPFTFTDEDEEINKHTFKEYLLYTDKNKGDMLISKMDKFVAASEIYLSNIKFPARNSNDRFDYLKALKIISSVHLDNCEFKTHGFKLRDVRCFFQDCQFYENWYIYDQPILINVSSVLYQNCVFHQYVGITSDNEDRGKFNSSLFNNCNFKSTLEFLNIEFNAPVFKNTDEVGTEINFFYLHNCVFKNKFILNNCKIDKYFEQGCVFESKFEFKNNRLGDFEIDDSNHLKLVDTYQTEYTKFRIYKSIFEDFVGFEKCKFGLAGNESKEHVPTFMYATFLSFVNFRNTTFQSGLDLEHVNLKESPNFLNVKIQSNSANRETFRIIKNSFEKIGNNIEANKFFVYEMKKYKEELKATNQYQEKFILFLSEHVSDFGQSYLKPISWIVCSSIIYSFLVTGYENNTLYKIYPSANYTIELFVNILNTWASNILPFDKFLKPKMQFLSLLFYIIFTSLIWQTVVALKKHTRK